MKTAINAIENAHLNPFSFLSTLPLALLGLLLLVLLLPPFGILITGASLPESFTILSIPMKPGVSSLSWSVWGIVALLITIALAPFLWRVSLYPISRDHHSLHRLSLPWWGWLAILWTATAWVLAWTRFSWFAPLQSHTFPLLWFGYIVTLNALTYKRSKHCLLLNDPRLLASLFLLSAGFWWAFEYLNQFVQNWHYVNVPNTSGLENAFFTSLAFSTVLPAVASTYAWLMTFPRLTAPFDNWQPIPWITHHNTGWIALSAGTIGLGVIGIWPTLLFPLVWLSPLTLLLAIQLFQKKQTCFHYLEKGDWCPVLLSALAALVCGFWWELWNAFSLVHWEYTIPYVQALKIFEMPVVGYAGYLPFGMLCVLVTEVGLGYRTNRLLRVDSQTWPDNAQ